MTDVSSIDRGESAATGRRRVGRYEVLHQIGRGGMAVVYLARQPAPERYIALKELGTFDSSEPQAAQRFVREAQFAGSLNHPNIVTVHEYFEDGGIPYIAMEYAKRGSLRPYVGCLSLPQIAGVLEGVLAGLAHAEQAGIVHRDLKPENLMVTEEGRVKITDFGIAKATLKVGASTFLTKEGMTVGTPIYMAPEQAVAADHIGPWTDLYSVGVMAYEHIVGRPPFRDEPTPVILFRHVNDRVPSASEVAPGVPPALSAWIDRLLVKSPTERTQSASEAWDTLEDIIIDLLGPRWRRDARLGDQMLDGKTAKPLTPAPFESTRMPTPAELRPASEEPVVAEPPAPALRDAAVAGSIAARAALDTRAPAADPAASTVGPSAAPVEPADEQRDKGLHAATTLPPAGREAAPAVEGQPSSEETAVVEDQPVSEEAAAAQDQHASQEAPAVEDPRVSEAAPAVVEQLLSDETLVAEDRRSVPDANPSQSGVEAPVVASGDTNDIAAAETVASAEPSDDPPEGTDRAARAQALTEQRRRQTRPYAAEPSPPVAPETIRRRRLAAIGAGLGLLVIAGIVIALVAGGGGSSKPKAQAQLTAGTAQSGPINIHYAAPWHPAAAAHTSVPGLMASQPAPIQLSSKGVGLLAGALATSSAIPGDVPPALQSRYGHPATSLDATVGGARAREYRWTINATGELDAFVVPTAAGDLAIVCNAPSGGGADMPSCASLATAAKLTGAQLLAPGPDSSLAASLARSVHAAASARGNLKGLGASKLTDRASAASSISKADTAAASSLAQLSVPARYKNSVSSLSSALRAEGVALASLARAAQHNDRKGYGSASKSVTSASNTVASAANALRADGLRLPTLSALKLPGLPAPPPAANQAGSTAPAASPSTPAPSSTSGSGSHSPQPSQSYTPPAQSQPSQSYTPPSNPSPPPPPKPSGGGTVTSPFR